MFIRPRTDSAYTLVEILIASAVGLMILGVVVNLLISTGRASSRGAAKVELQQKLLVLSNKLEADLSLANSASVAVDSTPTQTLLSIHRRVVDTSNVAWEPRAILYRGTDSLSRNEVELSPTPSGPFKPQDASQWSGLLSAPSKTSFHLKGLEHFEAGLEANGLFRLRVDLSVLDQSLSLKRLILLRQGQ